MEGTDGAGGAQAQSQQLVAELCRVQELVRQLELHLHAPTSGSSVDLCRRLAAEIVALTDRSIGMAARRHFPGTPPLCGLPSPLSDAGSGDQQPHFSRNASPKKRKATARWTSQVRVSAAGGAEGPADDGRSWRKYGQKDILGARHPRAYYRCTHRNSQGCPATKQVQRTDDDAALFDVVYHGEHTCRPGGAGARRPQTQHNPDAESLLQGLCARLTVATDCVAGGAAVPPMTPESCPAALGASSPWSLASPVDSDSNNGCCQGAYQPCPATGYGEWPSHGELQEVVSALAAVSGVHPPSPLDIEFMAMPEYFGFDQSFHIDDIDSMPNLFFP